SRPADTPDPHKLQAAPPQNPGAAGPQNPVAVSPAEALAEDALAAEDPPDLPLWTDLPERWKRLLDHDLARAEYRGELQREARRQREAERRPPSQSRHIIPRHPGLADLLS